MQARERVLSNAKAKGIEKTKAIISQKVSCADVWNRVTLSGIISPGKSVENFCKWQNFSRRKFDPAKIFPDEFIFDKVSSLNWKPLLHGSFTETIARIAGVKDTISFPHEKSNEDIMITQLRTNHRKWVTLNEPVWISDPIAILRCRYSDLIDLARNGRGTTSCYCFAIIS